MKFKKLHIGIGNPYELPGDEFVTLIVGFMLEDRPTETQRDDKNKIVVLGKADLLAYLEGDGVEGLGFSETVLADAYKDAIDPVTGETMDPLKAEFMVALRQADGSEQKDQVRRKYAAKFKARAETGGVG